MKTHQQQANVWTLSTCARGRFAGSRLWNWDTESSELLDLLRQASWVWQSPGRNPAGSRWTGAIIACHAVRRFLHSHAGLSLEVLAPLSEIEEGLKDLERGIVAPIFSLHEEPLERDRSWHRKFQQVWAAAILEIWVKAGLGERAAAEKIARKVNNWPDFKKQYITVHTLMNWRKSIKAKENISRELKQFNFLCTALQADPDAASIIEDVLTNGPFGV